MFFWLVIRAGSFTWITWRVGYSLHLLNLPNLVCENWWPDFLLKDIWSLTGSRIIKPLNNNWLLTLVAGRGSDGEEPTDNGGVRELLQQITAMPLLIR